MDRIQNKLFSDNCFGVEAFSTHLKTHISSLGNYHTSGIAMIMSPTLVPPIEYYKKLNRYRRSDTDKIGVEVRYK